jgi:tricorn protease
VSDLSTSDGYLRFPAIGAGTVYFVCEDDLWCVPATGGIARRLTADLADIGRPAVSPDGRHVAFTSTAEGAPEVYSMPADGGPARRLTWLADAATAVRGFTPDGDVLLISAAGQPFRRLTIAYAVPVEGGPTRRLPYGPVGDVAYGQSGVVVGRNTADPARWKRYRGGTAGRFWIDPSGGGEFRPLLADLDTNLASPLWIDDRIYFISDHQGIGNIYSCTPAGDDIRRHTDHDTYYARAASTDGRVIVYQHAAELWQLDLRSDRTEQLPVRLAGPRTQRARKFVDADSHLGDIALHPNGHTVVADVRGKLVTMPAWEEAAAQHGTAQGVRYRLSQFLDNERLCAVSDAGGEEGIEILSLAPGQEGASRNLAAGELGRVRELAVAPDGKTIAVANHRRQLLLIDVEDGTARVVEEAPGGLIAGLDWSADSAWLAYSYPVSLRTKGIRVLNAQSRETHEITEPRFVDTDPSFDPQGRYLYFLSRRTFNPVMDDVQFEGGFPKATLPYLVTLRADLPSPFIPTRRPLEKPDEKPDNKDDNEQPRTTIDFAGITERVIAFPLDEERYDQVIGIGDKVLLASHPVEGERGRSWLDGKPKAGVLAYWDLVEHQRKELTEDAAAISVSADHSTMLYRSGFRVRIVKAGAELPKDADEDSGRESGWVDLDRIRIAVDPGAEWPQMLAEAWRLQRDRFWVSDMSGVDWPAILHRYEPLAERVATRGEFSDLLWELQGELGTSHAYELGGDYRPTEHWDTGLLGADIEHQGGQWRIGRIVAGDTWDSEAGSPLAGPGLNVRPGDALLAVGGQPVDPQLGPGPLLVHQADQFVDLTVAGQDGAGPRRITVKALSDERPVRYREWVERNRRIVHEATEGRIGYLHIPDMGIDGFAEFHRGYLGEFDRSGLVVDVRFNGGGFVSALLLEKLARRRIGGDVSRWLPPIPYPEESPAGPMICLTNEQAGSDGDIFTHAFSLLGLGTVVGLRTWGGVIGISADVRLADGTITTQPEYAFWFADVGFGLENHGAEPDVEVDIAPQEYAAGLDPQLEKAIELAEAALAEHRPYAPDLTARANLAPAPLPTRT